MATKEIARNGRCDLMNNLRVRLLRTLWFCQCALYRPSTAQSSLNGFSFDAKLDRPISDTLRFSAIGYQASSPGVALLLSDCCPSAIAGLVVATIVNSLKRVLWTWPRPHVRKECFKRFPFIADGNSSAAIAIIFLVRYVLTAFFHVFPSRVFRGVALSVNSGLATRAALTFACTQFSAIDSRNFSAFATAVPIHCLVFCASDSNYGPFTKLLSSKIFESRVTPGRIGFSHDTSPESSMVRITRQLQLPSCSHSITPGIGETIHAS